jgi:hypothetical protein
MPFFLQTETKNIKQVSLQKGAENLEELAKYRTFTNLNNRIQ